MTEEAAEYKAPATPPIELLKALTKARDEFDEIAKDKINNHFKTKYASLDSINKSTGKALAKNGLCLTSHTAPSEDGLILTTCLWHVSGQYLDTIVVLPKAHDMQKLGSAMTYARRYSVSALLNVSADEDDDGNAQRPSQSQSQSRGRVATPKPQSNDVDEPTYSTISDAQAKRLFAIAKGSGYTTEGLKAMVAQFGFTCTGV